MTAMIGVKARVWAAVGRVGVCGQNVPGGMVGRLMGDENYDDVDDEGGDSEQFMSGPGSGMSRVVNHGVGLWCGYSKVCRGWGACRWQ